MTQAAILAASGSPGTTTGFKNRIINGNCNIAQRNGTTAVATNASGMVIDMWAVNASGNYGNWQQNLNSITPPAGFTSYLGGVSTGNYTFVSSNYCNLNPVIEWNNMADWNWGTANAQTITISFWIRASTTGTYSFAMSNGGNSRTYRTTYTINSANTWEYKTITIAGDTGGTWANGNNRGLQIWFGAGVGTTYAGAATTTWQSDFLFNTSGCVNWMGISGATWYITGLQVEVGTTATNFDFRSYGTELALCQRYYALVGSATGCGNNYNNTAAQMHFVYPVPMRVAPTANPTAALTITDSYVNLTQTTGQVNDSNLSTTGGFLNLGAFPSNTVGYRFYLFSSANSSGRFMTFSAEL